MPARDVTYDRPVKATLVVRLTNDAGEEWEATPEDLAKFGYVSRSDAYRVFYRKYVEVLDAAGLCGDNAENGYRDSSNAETGPLRHLFDIALNMPDLIDHPDYGGWAAIADIEQRLREHPKTNATLAAEAAAEAAAARCCPHNDDSHDGAGCLDCDCNKAPGSTGYNPTPGPDTTPTVSARD